jgi:hypothetical protein
MRGAGVYGLRRVLSFGFSFLFGFLSFLDVSPPLLSFAIYLLFI